MKNKLIAIYMVLAAIFLILIEIAGSFGGGKNQVFTLSVAAVIQLLSLAFVVIDDD